MVYEGGGILFAFQRKIAVARFACGEIALEGCGYAGGFGVGVSCPARGRWEEEIVFKGIAHAAGIVLFVLAGEGEGAGEGAVGMDFGGDAGSGTSGKEGEDKS